MNTGENSVFWLKGIYTDINSIDLPFIEWPVRFITILLTLLSRQKVRKILGLIWKNVEFWQFPFSPANKCNSEPQLKIVNFKGTVKEK